MSFQGAKVLEIVERFSDIINSHPQADKIIIQIGTNDIPQQQLLAPV